MASADASAVSLSQVASSLPSTSSPASYVSAPAPIDSLDAWLRAMTQPNALIELASLVACALLAWLAVRLLNRTQHAQNDASILFGRRIVDGVLFPLLLLALAYVAQTLLAQLFPLALFRLAIPVLLALAAIRLSVKVLQVAFKNAPVVRALERTFSWLAWALMVLWVSGLLPIILDELDGIKWKVGGSLLSVRALLQGALTAGVVLLITLWISSAIESRLLRSATGGELSLRKAVSNATRATLMFVGLLLALSSVGIDLTALSVLGGAIGVGVGFGLQKLASNYVSGFVMLAERSVRIGDNIRVDNFEGRITDINARYTVVRAPSGRESIVPNEMFIINRIENLSLSDTRVLQSTVVSVGYGSDEELVMRLLTEAALGQERVLPEPAAGVNLTNFGADGLEFTLNYWICDPENGMQNVRSKVNLAILKSLRAHHIEIPYPQRVIHTPANLAAGTGQATSLPDAGKALPVPE
ncbi:small-conductance mechanosensitive channel [Polaromonas sp. CG_9.7]|nr:small-conductance mechanosensitive channel [Polaromonas sp. CG_9.7]MBG6113173.1 small-conductance mechanosensitive channel [Polaromonas sp. CG_9.2]MDH6185705.1 small-conductance mechanosensitive channel [Polaromonas sp. CG_23.6]